jgi:hypothetical protein
MPLALRRVHGAYDADLNRLGPPGRRTDCQTKERRQQNAQKKMKLFHVIPFPFQNWQRFARFKKPVSQVKLLSRMSGEIFFEDMRALGIVRNLQSRSPQTTEER